MQANVVSWGNVGDTGLLGSVLNALSTHVAILDEGGRITLVNELWVRFAREIGNEGPEWSGIGILYVEACQKLFRLSSQEVDLLQGQLATVLAGTQEEIFADLSYEAAGGRRHFVARITRFREGDRIGAVVAHDDVTQQRQAESALRGSEARFRSLIENAADVITIVDAEGTIQYESPSAARILGYDIDQRRSRSFFDYIHADDLPAVLGEFSRSLDRPGRKAPLEYRCFHIDGTWRVMEGTAKNLLTDPSVNGVVLNYREVTERKRAEEAQARLTAVMDYSPNFVSIADSHGRLFYANQVTRKLLGLGDGDDPSQWNLLDLHPQWVSDLLLHEGIPTASREGQWSGEAALLDRDGNEIPVLQVLLAHRSSHGAVNFFSIIAHDITERKRTEEALRESHEVFRQIAENINEALWIFDLDQGRPIYISPGYERIWGRSILSVHEDPSSFLESVAPADRRRVSTGEKDGRGRDDEFRISRPDGSARWLRGRSFPIHDVRGSVCRIVGLTEDVTERRQMEDELRQAQRLEAIGHLAAGIAHEINTPIQYVGDNLQFLKESFEELSSLIRMQMDALEAGELTEAIRERLRKQAEASDLEYVLDEIPNALSQSADGVNSVAQIVRAMKDFSHPGTSERIPTDINKAVQSTLTVARNEWKYVAELVTDLDPSLPLVPCLPGELNQAVLNLIINAAHAISDAASSGTPNQGVLTVRTRQVDQWAEIHVQDTGTGIPDEVRAHMFDPFFTTKEVGRGTGQGLTLVHSVIVDKHGGAISVETEVGIGTNMILRLPLEEAGAQFTDETT